MSDKIIIADNESNWNVSWLAKMKGICFVLFIIQSVSIRADSDPMIIEGIIHQDAANSNEPRNGRQFQQLQARSSSSAKQNPEELISGKSLLFVVYMCTIITERYISYLIDHWIFLRWWSWFYAVIDTFHLKVCR